MKGWPASAEIEADVADRASTPSRIISLIASCIRKKGPRTLIAKHSVKQVGSGVEDRTAFSDAASIHKHIHAAETLVGFRDHASAILYRPEIAAHEQGGNARSRGDSLATAAPRSSLRPVTTIPAAPAAANRRAIAARDPVSRRRSRTL